MDNIQHNEIVSWTLSRSLSRLTVTIKKNGFRPETRVVYCEDASAPLWVDLILKSGVKETPDHIWWRQF